MDESGELAHLVARWGLKSSHTTRKLAEAEQMAGGTARAGVLPARAPQYLHWGLASSAARKVAVAPR